MAAARSVYPTLRDVLAPVKPLGGTGGSKKNPVSTIDGLQMGGIPKREGVFILEPEDLIAIRIPVQKIDGDAIRGYQRHLTVFKARAFARWLIQNPDHLDVIPAAEVSIDGNGNAFWTDGQHRAAGAVIARKPIKVIVTKRSETQARRLFALQGKSTKPSRNVLIFDGDGPYEEYIQDAVTDPDHPWHKLISTSHSGTSKSRMSATAALGMLRAYVGRTSHLAGSPTAAEEERFNDVVADDLAVLVSAFGTKQTNPYAFNSLSLRAIAETARQVFREHEPIASDRDRWIRHMTRFQFTRYGYVRSYIDLSRLMIEYWNKGLKAERKIVK